MGDETTIFVALLRVPEEGDYRSQCWSVFGTSREDCLNRAWKTWVEPALADTGWLTKHTLENPGHPLVKTLTLLHGDGHVEEALRLLFPVDDGLFMGPPELWALFEIHAGCMLPEKTSEEEILTPTWVVESRGDARRTFGIAHVVSEDPSKVLCGARHEFVWETVQIGGHLPRSYTPCGPCLTSLLKSLPEAVPRYHPRWTRQLLHHLSEAESAAHSLSHMVASLEPANEGARRAGEAWRQHSWKARWALLKAMEEAQS